MARLLSLKTLFMLAVLLLANSSVYGQTTDVLTAEKFTATTGSYTDFTGVAGASGAVYAGNTAKNPNNGSIKMRSSDNSGIVMTQSVANAKLIKVIWNSSTTEGRTIDVYGKGEAYSSAKDLYSTNTQGTKLGSVVYGSSEELIIDGNYAYIGLRSNDKVLYVDEFQIIYSTGDAGLLNRDLKFSTTSVTVNINEVSSFVEPELSGEKIDDVAYSSSNEAVATVDKNSGSVTINGIGETTITASAEETDEYSAASASYTLIVKAESKEYDGTYALVGEFGGEYYAMSTVASSSGENALEPVCVSSVIVNDKVILAEGDFRSNISWIITPSNGVYTIKTSEGKFLKGEKGNTYLTVGSGSCKWIWDDEQSAWLLEDGKSRTFLYRHTSSDDLKVFKNYAKSNIGNSEGGYASSTVAMPFVDGYTRDISSGNIGTICLPYAVKAADISGAEFYSVLGKRMVDGMVASVVFAQETEGLEAGVPYVFKPTGKSLVLAYDGEAVDEAKSVGGLHGTFSQTSVAKGMYLLSGGMIVKCGEDCDVAANRAYINMDEVPEYQEGATAKRILEIGGEEYVTSVEEVKNTKAETVNVYSVSGVLLRKGVEQVSATEGLPQGLYIIGDRKVVVR